MKNFSEECDVIQFKIKNLLTKLDKDTPIDNF